MIKCSKAENEQIHVQIYIYIYTHTVNRSDSTIYMLYNMFTSNILKNIKKYPLPVNTQI